MKNILLITSQIPFPLDSGGRVAIFEKVKFLNKNFNLKLIMLDFHGVYSSKKDEIDNFINNYSDEYYILNNKNKSNNGIKKKWNIIKEFIPFKPRFYHWFEHNTERVDYILDNENPDLIIFEGLQACSVFNFKKNYDKKTIYFAHNVEYKSLKKYNRGIKSNIIRKFYNNYETMRVFLYEKYICKSVNQIVCFTEADKYDLLNLINNNNISVIKPIMDYKKSLTSKREENTIFIPTNLKYYPNYESIDWFFRKVYKYLPENIEIYITGHDVDNYLEKANKKYKNVNYLGLVPRKELDDMYKTRSVFINPTKSGGGFQIKLLEAMSYQIPIVTSDFSNHIGEEIMSASNPKEFADKIIRQIKEPKVFNYKKYLNKQKKKMLDLLDGKRGEENTN